MESFWLNRYSIALAVCTLILVVAGASVTSKQAGLSVPDWPLSYGQVMPEMKGGVFYEHGHRMIASAVGFMTIVLAVWVWRVERRAWLKRFAWILLAAVILQGVLGGLTVLFLLPKAISIAHACVAQLFFSATVAVAVFTSRMWREETAMVNDSGWPSLRSLSVVAPVTVLAQLALGAAYRHQALGIVPHIVGAMIVMLVVMMAGIAVLTQSGGHRVLRGAAWALLGITGLQIVLGIVAYLARISVRGVSEPTIGLVIFTVAHVAVGALTMAASVVMAIEVFRYVRPRERVARGVAATS
jgi:cytochrome c oxidase assembly protein subunit 15